jgi:mono/diheme cytochrome c family protein
LLAVTFIYLKSNAILNKQHEVSLVDVSPPTDEASIAEGLRQVRVEQCNGCHGPNLTGTIMHEDFMVGRLVSANIPQRIKEHS